MKTGAAVLVGIAAMCCTASAQAEPDLAGTWHLDEPVVSSTTPDASGNGLTGQQVVATAGEGRFGGGFQLAAAGDGFLVPNNALLEPSSVTAMAWVKRAGTPGPYRTVIGKGALGCSDSTYALYSAANGGLQFYVTVDTGTHTVAFTAAIDPSRIWDGQWHAVAGTFDDATDTVTLYLDGQPVSSVPGPAGPLDYAAYPIKQLAVGRYPDPGCALAGFQYTGLIDEPRVYDRALSASEIGYLQSPEATSPRVLPIPADPPPTDPPPGGPPPGDPLIAQLPAGSIEFVGAASKPPPQPLVDALETVNLDAALTNPPTTAKVTKLRRAGKAKPNLAVAQRLASLQFGLPVEIEEPQSVTGPDFQYAEIAAAVAIERTIGEQIQTQVVALPPVTSLLDLDGTTTVVIPTNLVVSTADKHAQIVDAAVTYMMAMISVSETAADESDAAVDAAADRAAEIQAALAKAVELLAAQHASIAALFQRVKPGEGSVKSLLRKAEKASKQLFTAGLAAAQLTAPIVAPHVDELAPVVSSLKGCSKRCRFPVHGHP